MVCVAHINYGRTKLINVFYHLASLGVYPKGVACASPSLRMAGAQDMVNVINAYAPLPKNPSRFALRRKRASPSLRMESLRHVSYLNLVRLRQETRAVRKLPGYETCFKKTRSLVNSKAIMLIK